MINPTMGIGKPKNVFRSTTTSADMEETFFDFSCYSTATTKRTTHRYVLDGGSE